MKQFSPKAMALSLAAVMAVSSIPAAAAMSQPSIRIFPQNRNESSAISQSVENAALPGSLETSENTEENWQVPMTIRRQAPKKPILTVNEDGTGTLEDGTVVTLDENGAPVRPEGEEPVLTEERPELPEGIEEGQQPPMMNGAPAFGGEQGQAPGMNGSFSFGGGMSGPSGGFGGGPSGGFGGR